MYTSILFVHSWLRWIIVALIVVAITRSMRGATRGTPWIEIDTRVRVFSVAAFDVQVLLGLVLFVVSPVTPKSGAMMGLYMKDAALRFFTVEHQFAMLVALAALHIGSARSKRADNDLDRHKRWALSAGIALFFVLAAIPWPFLAYARPLFRLP